MEGPLADAFVLPFSEQFSHPENCEFKSLNFLIREQRNWTRRSEKSSSTLTRSVRTFHQRSYTSLNEPAQNRI